MPKLNSANSRQEPVDNSVIRVHRSPTPGEVWKAIVLSNKLGANTTFRVWYVAADGSRQDADLTHIDVPLQANDVYIWCFPQEHQTAKGDTLYFSSPGDVNIHLMGSPYGVN